MLGHSSWGRGRGELEHALVHLDPEHPNDAQGLTCPCKNWEVFQELCTDPETCGRALASGDGVDEGTTMGLGMASANHCAINRMHLRSLPIPEPGYLGYLGSLTQI